MAYGLKAPSCDPLSQILYRILWQVVLIDNTTSHDVTVKAQ